MPRTLPSVFHVWNSASPWKTCKSNPDFCFSSLAMLYSSLLLKCICMKLRDARRTRLQHTDSQLAQLSKHLITTPFSCCVFVCLFVYPCFNWWSLGLLPHLGYKYNAEKILVSLFIKCFYFSFVNSSEWVSQNQWIDICLTAEGTIKWASRPAHQ